MMLRTEFFMVLAYVFLAFFILATRPAKPATYNGAVNYEEAIVGVEGNQTARIVYWNKWVDRIAKASLKKLNSNFAFRLIAWPPNTKLDYTIVVYRDGRIAFVPRPCENWLYMRFVQQSWKELQYSKVTVFPKGSLRKQMVIELTDWARPKNFVPAAGNDEIVTGQI